MTDEEKCKLVSHLPKVDEVSTSTVYDVSSHLKLLLVSLSCFSFDVDFYENLGQRKVEAHPLDLLFIGLIFLVPLCGRYSPK